MSVKKIHRKRPLSKMPLACELANAFYRVGWKTYVVIDEDSDLLTLEVHGKRTRRY